MPEPTEYTHDLLLVCPVAYYDAARQVFAGVTGNPGDATAEWRAVSDGTRDPETGLLVHTHYAAHSGARGSTVERMSALANQIPGSAWRATARGQGTAQRERVLGATEALAAEGYVYHATETADGSPLPVPEEEP